jgi:hypothetical protein
MSGAEAEHQRLLQHSATIRVLGGSAMLVPGKWTADQAPTRDPKPLTQFLRAVDALHQQKAFELRHRIDAGPEPEAESDDPRTAYDIVIATQEGGADVLGARPAHRATYIGTQDRPNSRIWGDGYLHHHT